jgi:hypothetical protein
MFIQYSMRFATLLLGSTACLLAACASSGGYSGHGGMTAYKIEPDVYLYHYQHGFTGPDAMGWDPGLQSVWSRLGAAKTCGVPFAEDRMIEKLTARYGHGQLEHGTIGIGFHHRQSRAVPGFCTEARVAEVRQAVHAYEAGDFGVKP